MLHLRRSIHAPPPPLVPRDDEYLKSAQKVSTDALIEAVHQGPEVRRISSELRGRRIRNGFPDLISDAMERRPKGYP